MRQSRLFGHPFFFLFVSSALLSFLSAACSSPDGVRDGRTPQTVIVLSIDGFRSDYLEMYEPPNLMELAESGVHATDGMIPIFPSLTFPNHYSMATGLYPENHGMVDNTILDRETGKRFTMYDREAIEDPFWWGGEPIWVTAETQGVTTATFYWVGSEAPVKNVQPRYFKLFDGSISNRERIEQVLDWLDLPDADRPSFIGLYFGSVDAAGHDHGTDSPVVRTAVLDADRELGRLLNGLRERGIDEQVNVIVVSDHGMTDRSPERAFALDDYIDIEDLEIVTTSPVLGINVPRGNIDDVVESLQDVNPHLQVWSKKNLPERFHYGNHRWIPDVIGLVDDGWTLYRTREYMDERVADLRGATHGYDPALPNMRALFVARGPAFKSGIEIDSFECIHLYEMFARLLDVNPAPNDGDPDVLAPILR